ncbi:SulP family inorganic anion transporter [Desulfopila aestuarii]|uniref:High affinity sulphate transporter 1 n=1 Tax=Desulfopila aestuarii DSM 18488 TaxID=1121416 RepID=A0A1M7XVK9_9BACT|nr:SulP family inorganic anion transporter [Desulfopila aestuarii]SHO42679.1 high affinity sulphate transporter 1 [Desulfopila aestuarii DSM 18488]
MQNSDNTTTRSPASQRLYRFIPGVKTFIHYQRSYLRNDFLAGLSVAAVALPVGIAYAEIAGVPAVYGIYSAILPLLAYAIFGSSRQLITGPDAATCLMVAAAVSPMAGGNPQHYLELMVLITLLTGLCHIIFGICRLGFIANFLSQPILIGYLNGVAIIILIGQFPKLLGYHSEGGDFLQKLLELIDNVGMPHTPTLLLGGFSLITLILIKRLAPRLPAPLIVTVLSIIAVKILQLQASGVSVLGTVPSGIPTLHFPSFDNETFRRLLKHASGIALISFTSGILTAKSFASRNRYDIDADQELIAFGVCNIATGLVQGFPVTGADSRTAVNDNMGGKTQLVGIVAGGAMLLFLLFFTGPLSLLPNAALAAIVAIASIGLLDLTSIRELYKASRRELILSLITTAGVLYLDVLPAVFLAIMLTLLWMLHVASQPYCQILGRIKGLSGYHDVSKHPAATTIPGLMLYRFDGNILFFNVDYFRKSITTEIARSPTPVEWVVVDASPVNNIDITALHKLRDLRDELESKGITLLFARVKTSIWRFFDENWLKANLRYRNEERYHTLTSAVEAFNNWKHQQGDTKE